MMKRARFNGLAKTKEFRSTKHQKPQGNIDIPANRHATVLVKGLGGGNANIIDTEFDSRALILLQTQKWKVKVAVTRHFT